jgi:hypothetical protein
LNLLKRHQEATEVMFHHRIPTSTINVRNACHPFSTKDYFENQYVVIHNGVLHNEDLLKKEHDKLGIQYVSVQENGRFNDSEALAYDLARYFEGQVDTLTARGSIAFIAVKRDEAGKPVCLFFGRNYGNPLKMKRTKYSLTLSSEGKGEDVEAHTLYCFNYDTGELTKRPLNIPGYTYAPSRTYYPPTYTAPKKESVIDRGSSNGWKEEDDVFALDEYWKEKGEIQILRDGLLHDNNYDYLATIGQVNDSISRLQARQKRLDELSQMTDTELEALELDPQTAVDVNEYCDNEDSIRYFEEVVKDLRKEYARRINRGIKKDKENDAQQGMGFHYTPDSGQVHRVPQLPASTTSPIGKVLDKKLDERGLPKGSPYTD